MIVGVVKFRLHFPQAGSLKAKRKSLKSIKDRLKNRFNVSVAELEDMDLWQKSTIGVAVIANDGSFANGVLSRVVDLVNGQRDIVVTDIKMEWL